MILEVAVWAVDREPRYSYLQYGRRIQDGLNSPSKPLSSYFRRSAVEISVGVSTMASAVPALQPHSLGLCLLILSVLTFVNLPYINGKTVRGRVRVDCFSHNTEQTTSF
jgi:hypothetical protein